MQHATHLIFHATGFLKGTIAELLGFGISKVQMAITQSRAVAAATGILDFAQWTGGRVAIHKVVWRSQTMDILHIFRGVVNRGHRITIRDDVKGVLVQIFHRNRRIQCLSCNDRVGTAETDCRCLRLRTCNHCKAPLQTKTILWVKQSSESRAFPRR